MDYKNLSTFKFWCQKVLPLVYDESLSYYEVLCKVVDYINNIIANQREFYDELVAVSGDVETLKEQVSTLQTELEKIKDGEYMSIYIDALASWIDKNLQDLVSRIVKYVIFGLDNDGHFVAYIPSSWEFMKFDTIMDDSDLYGHLVMRW